VKVARAAVATTSGLMKTLARDWRRAARFYARFGITEWALRRGVPSESSSTPEMILETLFLRDDCGLLEWSHVMGILLG
jgi:hypothetical protein